MSTMQHFLKKNCGRTFRKKAVIFFLHLTVECFLKCSPPEMKKKQSTNHSGRLLHIHLLTIHTGFHCVKLQHTEFQLLKYYTNISSHINEADLEKTSNCLMSVTDFLRYFQNAENSVVERLPRMREIGVQSPVVTDLSR